MIKHFLPVIVLSTALVYINYEQDAQIDALNAQIAAFQKEAAKCTATEDELDAELYSIKDAQMSQAGDQIWKFNSIDSRINLLETQVQYLKERMYAKKNKKLPK